VRCCYDRTGAVRRGGLCLERGCCLRALVGLISIIGFSTLNKNSRKRSRILATGRLGWALVGVRPLLLRLRWQLLLRRRRRRRCGR